MITFRQINRENHLCYIFNNMINIKDFDPNLLNIDKVPFKGRSSIYYFQ